MISDREEPPVRLTIEITGAALTLAVKWLSEAETDEHLAELMRKGYWFNFYYVEDENLFYVTMGRRKDDAVEASAITPLVAMQKAVRKAWDAQVVIE